MKTILCSPSYSTFPLHEAFQPLGRFCSENGHVFTTVEKSAKLLKICNKVKFKLQKQPAKVLRQEEITNLLKAASATRHPARNRTMILLSFKAGLRAKEISGLVWQMVLGPSGRMKGTIELGMGVTKGGRYRAIPTSNDLQKTLKKLHIKQGRPKTGPVILSERGGAMTSPSVVSWFKGIYAELGMEGCSSHSGRRTFITSAARKLSKVDGSLRDVQELAGHRSLSTTERYIQGDRAIQRNLVNLI